MVEVRDVTKVFGDFVALDHVNLDIAEGEFMTFLGPSGCGKTTCLRLISGFEQPSSGQILIGGQDVSHDPPYKRNVNQVFQSYALFPHLTVRENIAFGLRMKKMSPEAIREKTEWAVAMTSLILSPTAAGRPGAPFRAGSRTTAAPACAAGRPGRRNGTGGRACAGDR